MHLQRASTWSSSSIFRALPVLIVTTQESGLQSVAAVEAYARKILDAHVVVLPGDCYHIAAAELDLCANHLSKFLREIAAKSGRKTQAGSEKVE